MCKHMQTCPSGQEEAMDWIPLELKAELGSHIAGDCSVILWKNSKDS